MYFFNQVYRDLIENPIYKNNVWMENDLIQQRGLDKYESKTFVTHKVISKNLKATQISSNKTDLRTEYFLFQNWIKSWNWIKAWKSFVM